MNQENQTSAPGVPASRRRVPFVYGTQLAAEPPALPGAFLRNRRVEPEWLDVLPETDLRAQESRADLRRLNRCLGHVRIAAATLRPVKTQKRPARITEIGAGDGSFLLQVARALGARWSGTQATLVDRQKLLTDDVTCAFSALGWVVHAHTGDVFDWSTKADPSSVLLANLFLHHFESGPLRRLLAALARQTSLFVAIEPRRSIVSLFFSQLVGLIGCNVVTRHDAPASVRAGFRGRELSMLWPQGAEWITRERRAGPFSHLFVACRQTY